jgi:hypothetical protein
VATTDGGHTLVLSNDSDFGIDGVVGSSPPFQLHAKINTAGVQDQGEFLMIDVDSLGGPPNPVPETRWPAALLVLPILGLVVVGARRTRRPKGLPSS